MKRLTLIFLLLVVAGCGLSTTDAERIARAEEQMTAGDYRAAMIELKNLLAADANNATARTMLATVSLGLGDVLSAEKELQRAAELDAPEATIRTIHLDILMAKRNFSEVLAALGSETGGLTQEQQWFYRGEALLGLNKAEAAEATFEEWLQSEPTSADANIGLARAEFQQGDVDSATTRLGATTVAAPDNFKAWQALGAVRFRSGDYEGAEFAMNSAADAIHAQSDIRRYMQILAGLIESQLTQDKHDAARRNLNRLTGVAPQAPVTLFLAARLARADGDYALASRHLQTLLNVSPENSQAQLFLANMQLMQGNIAQAERLLRRVVALSPDNIQARKLLAKSQLEQTQPGGAVEALGPLLESGQDDPDIYAILAQVSLQEGDTEAAIRQFRTASELAPDDMETKLNLVTAYLGAGEVSLALDMLEQVPAGAGALFRREQLLIAAYVADKRIDEADAVASRLLSQADQKELTTTIVAKYYRTTGRIDDARAVLRGLLQTQPDSISGNNWLARIEMFEENIDIAQGLFSTVLRVDDVNLTALLGLARLAQLAGEDGEVIRLLQKAAENHSRALGPRVLLVSKYLKNGDSEAAERMANELVSIGFRNSYISEVVARVFSDAGRTEDALYHFQEAARLNANSATIQLGLARAYLSSDQSVEAREALNRALEISPGMRAAMMMLALVEIKQGQLDAAQHLVAEYRVLHPDDVLGMILEGEVHLFKREFELAAQAFGRAVENGAGRSSLLRQFQALVNGKRPEPDEVLKGWLGKNPDDVVVRKFLAQHYQMNSRAELAIAEYQKVLEYAPKDSDVLNNLAWQYQKNGDLERAVELAEAAYEIDPESGSIADTLAWIYRDIGQLDKSSELLSDASRRSPDNGEIIYHYAVVLSDMGEKAKARQLLQALISEDAQFPSRKLADDLLGEL